MKVMHSEWSGRIKHWIRTLKDDFYEPLGEFRWEAARRRVRPLRKRTGFRNFPGRLGQRTSSLYGG